MRRNVVFESSAFNTTVPQATFVNPGCFGDDLASWLIDQLRRRGVKTSNVPGREDIGWYLSFDVAGHPYDFVIGWRPPERNAGGFWIGTIERKVGLIHSLLGARKRGISAAAISTIDDVLQSSDIIANVRWFNDDEISRI